MRSLNDMIACNACNWWTLRIDRTKRKLEEEEELNLYIKTKFVTKFVAQINFNRIFVAQNFSHAPNQLGSAFDPVPGYNPVTATTSQFIYLEIDA